MRKHFYKHLHPSLISMVRTMNYIQVDQILGLGCIMLSVFILCIMQNGVMQCAMLSLAVLNVDILNVVAQTKAPGFIEKI